MMNPQIEKQLKSLELSHLLNNWDAIFQDAQKNKPSYHTFLTQILEKEFFLKKEKKRLARIKRALIPQTWVMETFPFNQQPHLKKKLVLELYDSLNFMTQPQFLIFLGPTGCGKTGLATSFLIHALNHDYRGLFIDFMKLTDRLFQSLADHSENKMLAFFSSFDLLLIDEFGYRPISKEKAGLFFELIKLRYQKHSTIITSQLDFDEWNSKLNDPHLTSAILDRIQHHSTIFDMKNCISIRPKNIIHATSIPN